MLSRSSARVIGASSSTSPGSSSVVWTSSPPWVIRPNANTPCSVRVKPAADPAQPGDVEVAVVEHGHRIGQRDLAQPVDLRIRGARERDARQVAHRAAAAVAAHQVPRGQPVRPVRPAHVRGHRGVVLAQPGHLVPALDDGAEFAGALAEQALELRLRERHRLQRGIGQVREVHMHAAERKYGRRVAGSGWPLRAGPAGRGNAAAAGSGRRDRWPSGSPAAPAAAPAPAAALRPGAVHRPASGRSGPRPR